MKELIEKTLNETREFLNSPYMYDLNNDIKIYHEIIDYIEKDIFNYIDNDIVKQMENDTNDIIEKIINILKKLQFIYFEEPISKEHCIFVDNLTILINNWNDNIYRNEKISKYVKIVNLTYKQHHTIEQLLYHSKFLLHILKSNTSQVYNFVPELSKNYLKSFCNREDLKD